MPASDIPQIIHEFSWSDDWEGQRLKPIVHKLLPDLGSRGAFTIVSGGLVKDAKGLVLDNPDAVLEKGTNLRVDLRHGIHGKGKPKRPTLRDRVEVLLDDDHVVVVNKSAHILTAPVDRGKEPRKRTMGPPLTETLQHYWKANGKASVNPILVQRLDVETSGLLVLAKHPKAAAILQKQLKPPRTLTREYLAIVAGNFIHRKGVWKSHLGRGKNSLRQTVGDVMAKGGHVPAGSQYAETHYEVLEDLPGASLIRLKLATGRTHQIRIHCAEAGHPILGDDHYKVLSDLAFERFIKKDWRVLTVENPATEARALFDAGQKSVVWPTKMPRRTSLHATKLSFKHPVQRGKVVTIEAPLPADLVKYLEILRETKGKKGMDVAPRGKGGKR